MSTVTDQPEIFPPAFDDGYFDPPILPEARPLVVFRVAVGDPGDTIEWRAYQGDDVRSEFIQSWELAYLYFKLKALNDAGFHISIAINPRSARGDAAVNFARCVWVDGDGMFVGELDAIRERLGLPPFTMIVFSGHGVHGYWRLDIPVENIGAWLLLMRDIAAAMGTDPAVSNPERCMRLPGLLNVKREPHVLCEITSCNCTHRVTWKSIRGVIPTIVKVAPPPPRPIVIDRDRTGDPIRRCFAYLATMSAAISGANGHSAILKVAIAIVRFGIGDAEGRAILADWNSTNADPPFSDRQLDHKMREAVRLAGHERGIMLRDRWAP
jgi:hypothetical protein